MSIAKVEVTLTAAAAGNYSDNDVVSDNATTGTYLTIPRIGGIGGGGGKIVGAHMSLSEPLVVAGHRLWLLHTAPTASELNDNVAFSLDADDRAKVIGYIDFPALSDQGEVGFSQVTPGPCLLPFKCAVDDPDLYGILQITDADTNEAAGMTYRITLFAEQD